MKKLFLILSLALACNTLIAQNPQSKEEARKAKKEAREQAKKAKADARALEMVQIMESQEYRFYAERTVTDLSHKPFIDLAGDDYNVQVQGDQISLQLPFFGKSNTAMIGRQDSPLTFDATIDTYKATGNISSQDGLRIIIECTGSHNMYTRLTFYVFDNSDARLIVQKQGLSDIEFIGYIDKAVNIK